MNRKMATYLRFGPVVALLAILAVAFALVPAGPASGSAPVTDTTMASSPTTAGDAAEYRFDFPVNANLDANAAQIRFTMDKDIQIPESISRSSVLVSSHLVTGASGASPTTASGAGQFVALTIDPSFENYSFDSRRRVIKLTVPDMNPSTSDPGVGIQGIASGAHVTVIFTTAAGLKNPTEGETSSVLVEACQSACSAPVTDATAVAASKVDDTTPTATNTIIRELLVSAISGERGKKVTVTGKGFKDNTTVVLWRDANANGVRDSGEVDLATATVGSDDRFTATVVISNPPFVPGKGSITATPATGNRINAVDGRNNTITTAGLIPVFSLEGLLTVTPTSAALGDTITLQLKDFDASCNLAATAACTTNYTAAPSLKLGGTSFVKTSFGGTTTTNSTGEATFTALIPNGVPLGVQAVAIGNACCIGGGGDSATIRVNMTITGATITLTPATVVPNQTLSVIGRGFTDGGAATINLAADASVFSIGGSTADLKAAAGSASTKIAEGAKVTIDNGGNWSASVVVPVNTTTTTAGTHELKVIDSGGREGVVSLTIPARTLKLDPPASRLGTIVKVSGAGYPADNTKTGAAATPAVSIKYTVGSTDRIVATFTPDSSGNISGSFTVPLDAAIPSTNAVKGEYTTPGGSLVTTSAVHDVPKAEISVSPASGPPGTSVTVNASGYKSFSTVSELTIGDIDVRPAPVPATDGSGAFSAKALVPQLNTGVQTINVKVGGTVASASFIVTTAPVAPPAPPPAVTVGPAAGLAPLGANLVRTWGYNAATQKFQLYDPAAALLSDLTALNRGQGYWINVKAAQSATLGSGSYSLSAGWNLIGWLG